ncbi:hypothetical protein CDAR_13181 [Caerostris darwini]|uniref:Uncharacterized protein n=1 Tax=Caerostris darwini TaxID=1538125 RepID=A0AAV4R196_9ARAC|nr:hypothetical protein CDAR_13181 [Caerostris darwini]
MTRGGRDEKNAIKSLTRTREETTKASKIYKGSIKERFESMERLTIQPISGFGEKLDMPYSKFCARRKASASVSSVTQLTVVFRNKRKRGEPRAVRHRSVLIPPPRARCHSLTRRRKSDISGDDISRKGSTKEHFVSLYDRRSLSWSILFAAGPQPKQETRRQTLSKTV